MENQIISIVIESVVGAIAGYLLARYLRGRV